MRIPFWTPCAPASAGVFFCPGNRGCKSGEVIPSGPLCAKGGRLERFSCFSKAAVYFGDIKCALLKGVTQKLTDCFFIKDKS